MPHGRIGRRAFLKAASGAAALGFAGSLIPRAGLAGPDGGSLQDVNTLKALAMEALDAARSQGAQFADVRIDIEQFMRILIEHRGNVVRPNLRDSATVGVRAVVKGAWGFAGADGVTRETVRDVARLAVRRAAAGRSRRERAFEFAPAAIVRDGVWNTPIEIDPFTVPVREHEALVLAALDAASRAKSNGAVIRYAGATNFWVRSRRVFASTEGSFTSQLTFTGLPGVGVRVSPTDDDTVMLGFRVPTLRRGGYGYEAISRSNLKDEFVRTAEHALRVASLPVKSVDVGRYDLVLSPEVLAEVLVDTVGRALELDRAKDEKAAGAGTTYAMPPAEILGKYQLGSRILTVTADRSRPAANATVGWDEEGVKPDDFVLIDEGIVVDYVTTRRTAPTLADWYASRRQPLRSHGCATRSGSRQPMLQLPNLSIRPGPDGVAVEDLIRDVKRGFYVVRTAPGGISVDQQCINTQVAVGEAYEIRNGKLGPLMKDMALQFNAPQFWKSLNALAGPDSASVEDMQVDQIAGSLSHIGVLSVPALFRQVNVVNTGKQA